MIDQLALFSDFGHALGAAFEVNLSYSLLLKLDVFSAGRLARWVDFEKLRVIPPLAEDTGFNAPAFSKRLDDFEKSGRKSVFLTNVIAILWAMAAGVISLLFMMLLPFEIEYAVSQKEAVLWGIFLIGATPTGVLAWIAIQFVTWRKVKNYSASHNILIENRRNANAAHIKQTRQNLEKKLKAAREKDARSPRH
jgi:hypothetical protein